MKKINSSERRILDCMLDERSHSPRDLSIASGLTEPAVRYHLRKLVSLGLIHRTPTPGTSLKSGRKPDQYRRTSQDEKNTILRLTRSLLTHLEYFPGETDPAESLALWLLSSQDDSISSQRLSIIETTFWLCQNHYAASWIAGKSGPELLAANCPYCDMQPGLDLLCRMDTAILNRLTGLPWKKENRGAPASEGGTCRFILAE